MTTHVNDTVTEDEIVQAIRRAVEEAPDDEPGTITTKEAAEALDCSTRTALKRMKELMDEGIVKPDMVRRMDLWGNAGRVKGWRYTGEQT